MLFRLVYENSKLSDEIALIKQMKSQPLDNLKRQLVKLEEEVEKKNSIISSFQDKVIMCFKTVCFLYLLVIQEYFYRFFTVWSAIHRRM